MSGEVRSVVMIIGFFVFLFVVQSTINSLGTIDLLAGKYEKLVRQQQVRYKKALENSESEYETPPDESVMGIKIRKCCIDGEMFDDNLRCVQKKIFGEDGGIILNKSLLEKVAFIHTPTCNALESINAYSNAQFLVANNQSQFVINEAGELLQRNGASTKNNYSINYCIDKLINQRYYAIMVCPCRKYVCIKKCCQYDEYFDSNLFKCKRSLDSTSTIYFLNNRTTGYFLENSPLSCEDDEKLKIKDSGDSGDVLIQEDGSLIVQKEGAGNTRISFEKYCIDLFSDGKNSSRTNGFYCRVKKRRSFLRKPKQYLSFKPKF